MKQPPTPQRTRRAEVQALLDLPLHTDVDDAPAPFLRPKTRTRVRRARRGAFARVALAVQLTCTLLFGVAAVWAGYSRVMASERLRVARVEVRGNRFLSEGEVREMLGPTVGDNILTLDLEALKSRLRASSWVAAASVRRALPDTIQVEIDERRPLALAEVDRLYLMDGEGVLIDIYGPRTAGFDLPIVRGLAGLDESVRRDRAQRAGALLADLADLASEVSEVSVTDRGDLRLVLRGAGEVVLLGAPPCRAKLQTFLALRRELAERTPNAEYFDLRFRDRIYAKLRVEDKPAGGRAGGRAAGQGPGLQQTADTETDVKESIGR